MERKRIAKMTGDEQKSSPVRSTRGGGGRRPSVRSGATRNPYEFIRTRLGSLRYTAAAGFVAAAKDTLFQQLFAPPTQ